MVLGAVPRWLAGVSEVRAACAALSGSLASVLSQREYDTGVLRLDRLEMDGDREVRYSEYGAAAGFFAGDSEGKTFRLEVSPGTIALGSVDTNKAEKAVQRAFNRRTGVVDSLAGHVNDTDWSDAAIEAAMESYGKAVVDFETGEIFEEPRAAAVRAEVMEWSKRSRMRMVRAVAQLDYSDWLADSGDLAMVTLTYPDKWQLLTPDGKSMKNHFRTFQKRWARAVGPWRVLWKLEFQRRGAPHIHFLARVPALVGTVDFEDWLSLAWASVVGASEEVDRISDDGEVSSEYSRHLSAGTGVDFSGTKFSDPRRIALYFLGHSMKGPDGKEYQHTVPELWQAPGKGPGRFWGFSGFQRATVELELSLRDFQRFARELRKLQRARDWKAQLIKHRGIRYRIDGVPWTDAASKALPAHLIGVYKKRTRAMGAGGSVLGGWVLLNDALPVIEKLAVHFHATA
jgi:hypothetical protein